MTGREAPIGVFDSGFGGLTVMRSLVDQLPNEDFVYLGDTARAPYGPGRLRRSGSSLSRVSTTWPSEGSRRW